MAAEMQGNMLFVLHLLTNCLTIFLRDKNINVKNNKKPMAP